ncbi:hypothetical protein TNCV_787022 [Trichonephila clavipes]|nr:hypothetical protein TNCV_787022 [Trichonephila clavipes]
MKHVLTTCLTTAPHQRFISRQLFANHYTGGATPDDNACSAPIMGDKGIRKFVQSSKVLSSTVDSDDENEMNSEAPQFPRHSKFRISRKVRAVI